MKGINKLILFRIIFDIGFFLSMLLLPWWLTFILGFIGLIVFNTFVEALVAAFFMDMLYQKEITDLLATAIAIVLYSGVFLFKKSLRLGTLYRK